MILHRCSNDTKRFVNFYNAKFISVLFIVVFRFGVLLINW